MCLPVIIQNVLFISHAYLRMIPTQTLDYLYYTDYRSVVCVDVQCVYGLGMDVGASYKTRGMSAVHAANIGGVFSLAYILMNPARTLIV